jgi:hypothetical protein
MKLAEALMERADCQTRIRELTNRIERNAQVQEGSAPTEDPHALLEELDRVAERLEVLIRRINRTNLQVPIEGVGTVTDALARRDVLGYRLSALRDAARAGTLYLDVFTRHEVRRVSVVNVSDLQKRADRLAREWRELDTAIQAANWTHDLIA